jgi:hypothetical protein
MQQFDFTPPFNSSSGCLAGGEEMADGEGAGGGMDDGALSPMKAMLEHLQL